MPGFAGTAEHRARPKGRATGPALSAYVRDDMPCLRHCTIPFGDGPCSARHSTGTASRVMPVPMLGTAGMPALATSFLGCFQEIILLLMFKSEKAIYAEGELGKVLIQVKQRTKSYAHTGKFQDNTS